ncbi:MAG: translocation and assembly module TamA [Lentisphaeria bacterium]
MPRSAKWIKREAVSALQALGYYQAIIDVMSRDSGWELHIALGPPVLLRSFKISIEGAGKQDVTLRQFLRQIEVKVGQRLHHGKYENLKLELERIASERGYFDAHFVRKKLLVEPKKLSADIDLVFDTGTRYRFASIEIDGRQLSQKFLRSFLLFNSGEYFEQQKLIDTQQSFNRSGFFSQVNLQQKRDDRGKQVHTKLLLDDLDRYQFKARLGYSTDAEYRYSLTWADRRLNKKGHSYRFDMTLNQVEQGATFRYLVPLKSNDQFLESVVSFSNIYPDTGSSDLYRWKTLFHDRVSTRVNTIYSVAVGDENFRSNDGDRTEIYYIVPGWQFDYISVDDPWQEQDGFRWQFAVRASESTITSPDLNFLQIDTSARHIYSFSPKYRLLSRLRLAGTAMDTDNFIANMPNEFRFFAGGDTSVRGYGYQSLGPRNEDNEVLGGRHLVAGSVEADWRFRENWRLAVFTDVGNAFNYTESLQLFHSVGLGVRWITPIGSLRLDLARALDSPNSWRLHFVVGPEL